MNCSLLTSLLLPPVVLDDLICQRKQLRTGRGYSKSKSCPCCPYPHTPHLTLTLPRLQFNKMRLVPRPACVCGWAHSLCMRHKCEYLWPLDKRHTSFGVMGIKFIQVSRCVCGHQCVVIKNLLKKKVKYAALISMDEFKILFVITVSQLQS